MSRFIETIRIENGNPCRLEFHERRVRETIEYFYPGSPKWSLEAFLAEATIPSGSIYKCRITYAETPSGIEFERYTIQSISSLKLIY